MENKFSLFKSTASKEELIKINEAEQEYEIMWDIFIKRWWALGTTYQKLGANDTASKGAQIRWIIKQLRGDNGITKEELMERFNEVQSKLNMIYEIAKTEQVLEVKESEELK